MKDPLFTNKVLAAALVAGILIFGISILPRTFLGDHGGGHDREEGWPFPQYPEMDLGFDASHGGGEEAPVDIRTIWAGASIAGGERRAALCKSCHTFEEGGANAAGPNLWNIVGGPVASVTGFNYTGALSEFGGTWTYERLDAYLKNSQRYIPGTSMTQRFARDDQRADILAYLGSLSANPVAFPAPPPIVEESAAPIEESGLLDDAMDAGEGAAGKIENSFLETAKEVAEDAAEDVSGAIANDGDQ